jgi:hypothetical protein
VIEVEAAQVILVRLSLAAMLADDDAGNGLQDLAGALEGAPFDFLGSDHALSCGVGDPDQVIHRLVEIGEIAKGLLGGDDHVGARGEIERGIGARRRTGADHETAANARGKVDEMKRDVVRTRRQRERVGAVRSGNGRLYDAALRRCGLHGDAGKEGVRRIEHPAGQRRLLRVQAEGNRGKHQEPGDAKQSQRVHSVNYGSSERSDVVDGVNVRGRPPGPPSPLRRS